MIKKYVINTKVIIYYYLSLFDFIRSFVTFEGKKYRIERRM